MTDFQLRNLSNNFLRLFEESKNYKFPEIKLKLFKNKTNEKYVQKIGLAFYGDHNLIIASTTVDLNNNIKIIS